MEIWIRTQNRNLLLKITKFKIYNTCQNSNIIGVDITGKEEILGIYKNEERSLEILNEIQNKILKNIKRSNEI